MARGPATAQENYAYATTNNSLNFFLATFGTYFYRRGFDALKFFKLIFAGTAFVFIGGHYTLHFHMLFNITYF